MTRRLAPADGFTLIELMIVVAIIGILASLAIPNFLKFQCRAKQAEAKSNLSGLYTAEKSFFAEFNTYGTDLISINWIPDGSPLYIYGYTQAFPSASSLLNITSYDGNRDNTMATSVIGSPAKFSTIKTKSANGTPLSSANLPSTSITNGMFTAGAAGDIFPDPASLQDKWVINNTRTLQNTLNDCAG